METVEKTCSCFGHSYVDITDDLVARTRIEIDRAIADGVRIFLFGGMSYKPMSPKRKQEKIPLPL